MLVFVAFQLKCNSHKCLTVSPLSLVWLSLPSQSAPESRKKNKPTSLCTLHEFLNQMCQPCLIITQSSHFDYRINKPFSHSCCLICVSCFTRDLDVLRAQRLMGCFILITHKSLRSENPIT